MNIHVSKRPAAARSIRLFAVMLAALWLAGCASSGGLHTHARLADAAQYGASASLKGVRLSAAAWPRQQWWQSFGDQQLDDLMARALRDQPRLKIAEARVRAAQAVAGIAGAPLYPSVSMHANSERRRFSEHGTVPPPIAGSWQTVNSIALGLNYDFDFWGKHHAALEAALDQVHASQVDLQAARLMLSTAVVRTYLRLDAVYAQRDLAQAALAQRQEVVALTHARVSAQIDSGVQQTAADAALPAIRGGIDALDGTISLLCNQLAALAGEGPGAGLALRRPQLSAPNAVRLPTKIPAHLIGRRPDVVAQRWRVEAAQQNIKVARAAFYPDISLNAFVGLQRLGFSQFLSAGSRDLGVGPAITLPLFEGGRMRGNLALHQAVYDAAVERYNATVLSAVHDVVDQLTALDANERQRHEQMQDLELARHARDLAALRYQQGLANKLQVLAADGRVIAVRGNLIRVTERSRELRLNLTRALGGGDTSAAAVHASANTPSQNKGA